MFERAYAKINVSLNVIGSRDNGYHDLDMLMVPIGLYDGLTMELDRQTSFKCDVRMQYNEKNTIYKAVSAMTSRFSLTQQFRISLTKHIPFLSGLAGGSSDAAAALLLVNALANLKLSIPQLAEIGAQIGSDIPFFLYKRCARVTGLGEKIAPFDLPVNYQVILIKPARGISTKWAYENLDMTTCPHPDISLVQQAFADHQPLGPLLGNSLQPAAVSQLPVIEQIRQECIQLGFDQVLMSGSGSTVFVLAEMNADTSQLLQQMRRRYPFVYKTSIVI